MGWYNLFVQIMVIFFIILSGTTSGSNIKHFTFKIYSYEQVTSVHFCKLQNSVLYTTAGKTLLICSKKLLGLLGMMISTFCGSL